MHISPEQVLKAIDEQKAELTRLSHQFDADELEVVMRKSLALIVVLQKLIAEHTTEREELVREEWSPTDLPAWPS
jgi:hypothetical protein